VIPPPILEAKEHSNANILASLRGTKPDLIHALDHVEAAATQAVKGTSLRADFIPLNVRPMDLMPAPLCILMASIDPDPFQDLLITPTQNKA
jgi:hypothetical protein